MKDKKLHAIWERTAWECDQAVFYIYCSNDIRASSMLIMNIIMMHEHN